MTDQLQVNPDPALVLTILNGRAAADPFLAEVVRSCTLEAALLEAHQELDDLTPDDDVAENGEVTDATVG